MFIDVENPLRRWCAMDCSSLGQMVIFLHTPTLKFVVSFLLQYWKSKAIAINNAFFDEMFVVKYPC